MRAPDGRTSTRSFFFATRVRRARHFDLFFATRARRARHFEILFVTKKLSLTYTYPNVFPIFYCVQKKKLRNFKNYLQPASCQAVQELMASLTTAAGLKQCEPSLQLDLYALLPATLCMA